MKLAEPKFDSIELKLKTFQREEREIRSSYLSRKLQGVREKRWKLCDGASEGSGACVLFCKENQFINI